MPRLTVIAFLLWVAAAVGLVAVVAYKILTDTSVPLFGLGW